MSDDFDASEGEENDFDDDELYSYLPGSCTDGLDLPEAGISQNQDDSLTVEEVQLSPVDGRLQSLSTEDFLAPTNSKKTCVTVQLVYIKHLCQCKNNMSVEATESFVGIQFFVYTVHTINIAVYRETCTETTLSIYTD